ncbi:hypothetical protein [Rossellomorea sp. YZS02]|uniref:hypothetical protein n=1 Tax=Rossellomorea sp. YZS02 TaxID=3097358 RepID=UPI002A136EEC|nr:hypothetical protein [Rossellomorea sp. YZS02]MDX8344103.1 hypothetical protein [Rossellomorea sp. YZS02]
MDFKFIKKNNLTMKNHSLSVGDEKKMNLKKVVIIFLFLFLISSMVNKTYADEENLILIPNEKYLFKISNMKPGDWAERSLKIKNGGGEDFHYSIKVNNKQSDKKLFNELELKVYAGNNSIKIFDDKLKNFKGFKPKELESEKTESLQFKVIMPYELGNDFQRTSAFFEIIITVVPSDGNTLPDDPKDTINNPLTPVNSDLKNIPSIPVESQGPKLPNTSTNLYFLLMLGSLLTTVGFIIIYLNKRLLRKKE